MRVAGVVASLIFVGVPALEACTSTANISNVYMSLDSDGARRRDTFFTDSTEIHCIAEGGFGRPDVTVEGRLHQIVGYNFETDKFDTVDKYVADVDIHPEVEQGGNAPPTKIDVQLERVDKNNQPSDNAPFPAGSFVCEILLDGKIEKAVRFNIQLADCPAAQIASGGNCFGFVEQNRKCPKYGALSPSNPGCTCTVDKGWSCDPG